ncbi:hypothetical protein BH10PAT4_BH10PAT4_0820 [soil metagenome]
MYVSVAHISRKLFPYLLLLGIFIGLFFMMTKPAQAVAGINQQVNFQGRLLNTAGATVPDGYYNIQFKIYQDGDGLTAGNTTGSPAGSLKWTENYLNVSTQGVVVINGFMSVQLGSITPFGSSIDWNQNTLWLSMNIGNTNVSCTPFSSCSPDGEMLPMKRLSSSPYALNSGQLGGLSSTQFLQIAQGVQTDASVGVNSIYVNKTNTGNFVGFQSAGVDVFTLTNAGDITLGANANHTLSVATASASVVGKSLTLSAGTGGTGAGTVAGGDLVLQGGVGGGTNSAGGNVSINAGAASGSGAAGTISIGASQASTVQIGNSALSSGTQTVNIGNSNTSGGTTNVAIGAGGSATGGTTSISSKGNTTLSTNGTARATLDTTGKLFLGDGTTSTSTGTFTLLGSTGAASNAGYSLAVQGGTSGTGAVNGGDVTLQGGATGGTGVQGQVKFANSGFTTATTQNFSASANVTQANVDNFSSIEITATGAGPWTATIPAPTTKYNGRLLYVQVSTISGATSITLAPSGGTSISMNPSTATTFVWNTTANAWLNAGADSGSPSYIQNQTAVTQTAGFKINGVGTAANFVGSGLDVTAAGTLSLGTATSNAVTIGNATVASTIGIGGTGANTITLGNTQTAGSISVGSALTSGSVSIGGTAGGTSTLTLQGGTSATAVAIQSGTGGTIGIGTNNIANTVQIGSTTLSSGTQTIAIGNNNTSGGTTNVTIGNGSTATSGTTTLQAKTSITINTNGITRGTFDNANSLYLGNGVTAAAPNNFAVIGTGSSTTAVTGGGLTIQGGNATVGNASGGNLTLNGGAGVGTGVSGLVVINTPTYQTTANDTSCFPSGAPTGSTCTFTSASINSSSALIAGFTITGLNANLPDPTNTTAGRVVYITASLTSADFTLRANIGAGTGIEQNIAMRKNTTATMIWNGADWTAAGASSSTTLQASYDNTLQSAGGAELVVSSTAATNGLTIRDSATAPVNGTLLSVQTASAASLISINGNVTEYASNSGAETAGASSSTFPASTWGSAPVAATISRNTTTSNIATGQGSVSVVTSTTALSGVKNTLSTSLTANQHYNVSFTTRLSSGTFTDMEVYYSNQGTNSSVLCTSAQAVKTSVWTKVNCTFTASASGITSSNAIIIRQTGSGTARTFFVDNLSVTIAADYNYATDGGADDSGNFNTNWVSAGAGTVIMTQNTTDGQAASSSAQAAISTNTALAGMRNKLAINPLSSTLYRVSTYAKLSSGAFTDFTVRYSPDNGSTFVNCVDYNTQVVTTSGWTQITCYINTVGTTVTNPYMYFVQNAAPGGARTFLVDTFSMTLASNSTPNVQVGGGVNGGPTTLFTLDKGASAPIAANNDALLGSMYYDTTLGKLQCYEADGWGACGSSPDNVITISPEFTNAVLHGTGVGTMTSDICSDTLNINDGSSGQPTICGSNETYNFYKWTSPQATAQTYSIYVTYQLPGTFNTFASGQTSIMGRTDSASSTVQYQVYRNNASLGLVSCGSLVSVSTGSVSSWQTGIASGAADPSTCGFAPSDSIVFKINVISSVNANAYVGNLNFIFSNK